MSTIRIFAFVATSFSVMGCGLIGHEPGPAGKDGAPGRDGAPGAQGVEGPVGITGKDAIGNGTRIKAIWRESDDGAREPAGWSDSKTGQRCSWRIAADGIERCLPVLHKSDLFRVFYPSSTCAGEGIAVGVEQGGAPCDPIGSYVEDYQHQACNAGMVVYSVGPKFQGEQPVYYSTGDDPMSCFANFGQKFDYYSLTAESPSDFVGAVEK